MRPGIVGEIGALVGRDVADLVLGIVVEGDLSMPVAHEFADQLGIEVRRAGSYPQVIEVLQVDPIGTVLDDLRVRFRPEDLQVFPGR
jgi:hypothetical protein